MDENPRAIIAAATGITGDYTKRVAALIDAGAEVICLDVAHGHHILMERAIKSLRDTHDDFVHLMAGNVATADGFRALADWGADSVRVGIGGGSICSTRLQTGHGVPSITSIIECASLGLETRIIADGGIKNSGDIVKALALGADFVMVGSLLAGSDQTPGNLIELTGKKYKCYRGMASVEAQKDWRGETSSLEGVSTMVLHKGDVMDVLEELKKSIGSGFSYSGASCIEELWSQSEFIKQSRLGQVESSTHILKK